MNVSKKLLVDKAGFPKTLVSGEYLPPALTFDISNICNVSCIMCEKAQTIKKTGQRPEPYMLTLEGIKKKVGNIYHIKSALISGSHCEPLINKELPKIIFYLKKKGAEVCILTNAVLLNEFMIEKFVYLGLDKLRISLHGATKETAERIMERADFPLIISNIRKLIEFKRALSSKSPFIEFAFVGMKQNIHEFSDVVALAGELGVDKVELASLVERQEESMDFLKGESLIHSPELLKEEYERALAVARKYDIELSTNDPYRMIVASETGS